MVSFFKDSYWKSTRTAPIRPDFYQKSTLAAFFSEGQHRPGKYARLLQHFSTFQVGGTKLGRRHAFPLLKHPIEIR